MIKMVSLGLLLVSISGCAPLSDVKNVNCTGLYVTRQGAANEKRIATIRVNKVRIDHNGKFWIHPEHSRIIRFQSAWQSADVLTNYQCKGEDYGLRGAAL